MREFFYKLFENIKLAFKPIIINAFIFYDSRGRIKHENWGDDLNYYFIKEITNRPIVIYNRSCLAMRLNLNNFLVIGSTIDMLCKKNTKVWGAGIINNMEGIKIKPKKIYAVRGPLSREILLSRNIECPEIYGDPALLLPLYYRPTISKRYKYGIISHVSNENYLRTMTLDNTAIFERNDVLIISMKNYNNWQDIIDKICSCKAILSASLHGLIVAEAYNIPNVWIEFGSPLIGDHFKFHDFFLSIKHDRLNPMRIIDNNISSVDIENELNNWINGSINLQPLIDACPFSLKKPIFDN